MGIVCFVILKSDRRNIGKMISIVTLFNCKNQAALFKNYYVRR